MIKYIFKDAKKFFYLTSNHLHLISKAQKSQTEVSISENISDIQDEQKRNSTVVFQVNA